MIIGYAYAGIFYDRRAYDWSAEMSVYVQRGIHGKGVGTALYEKMEESVSYTHLISCRANCICPPGAKHKCTERRAIPGSVAFVPSVVGLIIAGEVVKDIACLLYTSTCV